MVNNYNSSRKLPHSQTSLIPARGSRGGSRFRGRSLSRGGSRFRGGSLSRGGNRSRGGSLSRGGSIARVSSTAVIVPGAIPKTGNSSNQSRAIDVEGTLKEGSRVKVVVTTVSIAITRQQHGTNMVQSKEANVRVGIVVAIPIGGTAAVVAGTVVVTLCSFVEIRDRCEREICGRKQMRARTDLPIRSRRRDGVAFTA